MLSENSPSATLSDGRNETRPFDGKTYVACSGLGTHEAISIALCVRADTLGQTWNPLVFGDDIRTGTTHVSLLADGRPNVAIHTGGQNWTHRTARKSVAAGEWHHLAFVCDARLGGSVRFYLDGQCVGSERLNCGIRLDLDGFRLGAWNQWESDPLKKLPRNDERRAHLPRPFDRRGGCAAGRSLSVRSDSLRTTWWWYSVT